MGSRQEVRTFTVVIIDDKEICCRRIAQRIQGLRRIGDLDIAVVAKPVHVGVQSKGGTDSSGWTFTPATLTGLSDAADSRPDLLVVDYIYIDDGVAAEMKGRALQTEVSRADRESSSLAPRDLRNWVENHADADGRQRRRIMKRIFESKGPLYLHSYTPKGLELAVGTVQERGNDAGVVFPNVPSDSLNVIDTRDLLFADDEFDNPPDRTHYEREYYAYLLGVLFNEIVQKEIYKRHLHRSKFLRLKRSAPVLAVIGGIGAGVGFASSFAGVFAYELYRDEHGLAALAMLLLMVIVAIPLGWLVARVFEELMARLLPER